MSDVFQNIDPHPLSARRVCNPPPSVRGEDTLAEWRGGGGSIFWKTPDTALYSTYVSTLCYVASHHVYFTIRCHENIPWTREGSLNKITGIINPMELKKYLLTLWQYSPKKWSMSRFFQSTEKWRVEGKRASKHLKKGERGEHAQFALVSLTTENIEMYSGLIWKLRSFRKMGEWGLQLSWTQREVKKLEKWRLSFLKR